MAFIKEHYHEPVSIRAMAQTLRPLAWFVPSPVQGYVSVHAPHLRSAAARQDELSRPGLFATSDRRGGRRMRILGSEPFHQRVPPHHGRNPPQLPPPTQPLERVTGSGSFLPVSDTFLLDRNPGEVEDTPNQQGRALNRGSADCVKIRPQGDCHAATRFIRRRRDRRCGRLGAVPHAQTAARANWLTDGADPQRTSWQRHETLISPASVKDMTLLWKVKLDNQPREMHNLFAPLILGDLQLPAAHAKSPWSPASPTTSTASTSSRARRSGSVISTAPSMTPAGAAARSVLAGRRRRRSRCRRTLPASTSCTRFRGMDDCARWIRRPAGRSPAPSRFCHRMASPTR